MRKHHMMVRAEERSNATDNDSPVRRPLSPVPSPEVYQSPPGATASAAPVYLSVVSPSEKSLLYSPASIIVPVIDDYKR